MKNYFLSLLLLVITNVVILAQAPNIFKYQAVVRDTSGNIIEDQNVGIKIDILQGNSSGTSVYSEDHPVTTNQFGLINLEIGGGNIISGDFTIIDWGSDEYFVEIGLDVTGGTTYETMGTSQLFSVPYALYSEKSGDISIWKKNGNDAYYNEGNVGVGTISPNGKLQVSSDTTAGINDVIFSVLNAVGDTVFAVYQEGVRIWVSDDTTGTKANGSRGGFAVGGFNPAKSVTNEYFRVTPDSVRVYIREGSGTKANGSRGGFAVGGFNPAKAFTSEFLRVTDDSSRFWTYGDGGFGIMDLETGSSNYMDLTPNNYFIGHNAGINTTTGFYNSFIGYESGYENIDGEENIFIGYESGYSNINGYENVFLGNGSGYFNTSGYGNVFLGNYSGYNNDTASYNVFVGNNTGYANTFGCSNVFVGDAAGENNTTGSSNIFIGDWSGANNIDGEDNIFMGNEAGWSNNSGSYNIFIGTGSGYSNDTAEGNIFIGDVSGYSNTFGENNVFLGSEAGFSNIIGNENVFLGNASGYENIDGELNVFLGQDAGYNCLSGYGNIFVGGYSGNGNTIGSENIFIGAEAGFENIDGDANIFVGNKAGYYETGSNLLYIENSDSDVPLIHGDFDTDKVTINDVLILTPRAGAPIAPVEGELYVNSTNHHIYCYLNGGWVQLD